MWTAIWTIVVFVLLLFLGDSILAFAAEQLRERRTHRLALERERTKQAIAAQQRDELIWRQLGAAGGGEQASEPAGRAISESS